jgi:hypothetical protein
MLMKVVVQDCGLNFNRRLAVDVRLEVIHRSQFIETSVGAMGAYEHLDATVRQQTILQQRCSTRLPRAGFERL